ncbi:MAG: Xaa-Pro peptidase family protein [Alphaproteobacteria bacterium]|nr:Xaa-Pro peptidase family protein [Alphaproteobacteria bacterium]
MIKHAPFPKEELDRRIDRVKATLSEQNLDGIVVSVPENIYYLTGMDHLGFFAAHVLVINSDGKMALACRAMEKITFDNQVRNARFYGHQDHEELADYVVQAMKDLGLSGSRVALERRSLFLHLHHAEGILAKMQGVEWVEGSGLVDNLRQAKSPLEIEYTRKAARAADLGMSACIEVIRDGVTDYEIAAEYMRVSTLEGSEPTGFGPFIRPTTRLGEEHTTWRGENFRNGDAVFLENAASYRKYHAPMGRLVYVGRAPDGVEKSAQLAMDGMKAICGALKVGEKAGEAYAAWREVAASAGLADYERHHCGYMVGIGFPPSWTGGSMVTSLFPGSERTLEIGMVFHAHSWFTNTDVVDYFISNTVILTENGAEVLTATTPENLIIR